MLAIVIKTVTLLRAGTRSKTQKHFIYKVIMPLMSLRNYSFAGLLRQVFKKLIKDPF